MLNGLDLHEVTKQTRASIHSQTFFQTFFHNDQRGYGICGECLNDVGNQATPRLAVCLVWHRRKTDVDILV